MEIVKLGDICNINIGTTPSTGNNKFWDGTVSFYDGSLTSKRYITKLAVNQLKLKLTKENSFVMSIFGNYSPILIPPGSYYNQQIALITSKNELIVSHKYIYYWIKKNQVYIKSNSIGTVANHINKNILTNLNFSHPSFIQQQTIIDIIEPFDILVELVFKKIKINEKIAELIINNFYRKNGLFKENEIEFFKGINFKKGMISENNSDILFINVSAINDKPNKFIKLEYINMINVFEGDVVLSLDGNTGLVNNCLKGINGYGYKIASNKIKNSQIYYSLLSKINQDIIDQNSFGTTIQHASKSKDKIILLNFGENQKILDIFFDLEIIYKKKAKLLKKIISSLIEIYTR